MPKIIVLDCVNDLGDAEDLIFLGNEYARDPADILQLVHQQFKSDLFGDELTVEQPRFGTVNDQVIAVLNKNGYTMYHPKRIIL